MLSVSKNANPNYLAKVVRLDNLRKHGNADRLQVTTIDFNDVILGLEAKVGDVYIYFPIESQINSDFLAFNNSFESQLLNKDTTIKGYFGKQCRVRAVKLRGERSMGVLFPVDSLARFVNDVRDNYDGWIGCEFDMIDDITIVKKYEIPLPDNTRVKMGKKPRVSKLIDGQVRLHVDTNNFRKEGYKLKPNDFIGITNKLHGTSFHVHNVIVKRKLSLIDKLLKACGVKIQDTEYDYVYGSRKVIKNQFETQEVNDFYDGDLYAEIKEELKGLIPKNYNVYGECVGYTKTGSPIQIGYDYGCKPSEHKIFIYRITIVNEDGTMTELDSLTIKKFCDKNGLNYVPMYYIGYAKDLYKKIRVTKGYNWNKKLVAELEKDYATGICDMCTGNVPREGIVIRVENLEWFEAYKLKSFEFLEHETKMLDQNILDMESNN